MTEHPYARSAELLTSTPLEKTAAMWRRSQPRESFSTSGDFDLKDLRRTQQPNQTTNMRTSRLIDELRIAEQKVLDKIKIDAHGAWVRKYDEVEECFCRVRGWLETIGD